MLHLKRLSRPPLGFAAPLSIAATRISSPEWNFYVVLRTSALRRRAGSKQSVPRRHSPNCPDVRYCLLPNLHARAAAKEKAAANVEESGERSGGGHRRGYRRHHCGAEP